MWVDKEIIKIESEQHRKPNKRMDMFIFIKFMCMLFLCIAPVAIDKAIHYKQSGIFGWKCYRCGNLNGDSFNSCQNCGARR